MRMGTKWSAYFRGWFNHHKNFLAKSREYDKDDQLQRKNLKFGSSKNFYLNSLLNNSTWNSFPFFSILLKINTQALEKIYKQNKYLLNIWSVFIVFCWDHNFQTSTFVLILLNCSLPLWVSSGLEKLQDTSCCCHAWCDSTERNSYSLEEKISSIYLSVKSCEQEQAVHI